MKPPMDTTIPRMNDRHVRYLTGLSSMMPLSFSAIESVLEGVVACECSCCSALGLKRPLMSTPMMKYSHLCVVRSLQWGKRDEKLGGDAREEKLGDVGGRRGFIWRSEYTPGELRDNVTRDHDVKPDNRFSETFNYRQHYLLCNESGDRMGE